MNWEKILKQLFMLALNRILWNPLTINNNTKEIIESNLTKQNIFLADRQYKTVEKDLVHSYLNLDPLNLEEWKGEIFDCDDFAVQLYARFKYIFRGAAFGVCWVVEPSHALNFFIDKSLNVWLVEPQTDDIFQKPKDWKVWFVLI